jgi:hypothetical protein
MDLSHDGLLRSVSGDGTGSYLTYSSFGETVSIDSAHSSIFYTEHNNSAANDIVSDTERDDEWYYCFENADDVMDCRQYDGNKVNICHSQEISFLTEGLEFSHEENRYFSRIKEWLSALIQESPAQRVIYGFLDIDLKSLYGVSLPCFEKWIRNESPEVFLRETICDGVLYIMLQEKVIGVDLYVELERTLTERGETSPTTSDVASSDDDDEESVSLHHDVTSVSFHPMKNEKWLCDAIRNSAVSGVLPWDDIFHRYQDKSCILSSLLIALGPETVQSLVWSGPPQSQGRGAGSGILSYVKPRDHNR